MRGSQDQERHWGPMPRHTHRTSVGSRSPLSECELPSGLGSLELQVGRFAREDQGDPRKEKKDSRKNLLTKEGWPVTRGVYIEAGTLFCKENNVGTPQCKVDKH